MALGLMMALYHRSMTGEGQYIDIAMTDALVGMLEHYMIYATVFGEDAKRCGNRDPAAYPYDLFESKDGYCILGHSNVSDWSPFARACGIEHLVDDPRFLTNELRVKNADELFPYINNWSKQHTREEIYEAFAAEKQAYSPVLTPGEVAENEHILSRGMIVEMEDPVFGKYKMQGIPLKMSKTPGQIRSAAPEMGQDTDDILKEIGYSEEQIKEMRSNKII